MKLIGTLRNTLVALSVASLCACGGSGNSGTPANNPNPVPGLVATPKTMLELEQPATCDAIKSYISDSIAEFVLNMQFVRCLNCEVTLAGGAARDAALGTDPTSFSEFTQTNNQEAGVDELDSVETDAQGNFYLIDGGTLVVANGLPPSSLRQIASLDLKTNGYAEGLLLDPANKRLVVAIAAVGSFDPVPLGILPPQSADPIIELLFVDVADPTQPRIERRLKIEGFKLAVRRIGARIHVISHLTPVMHNSISSDARVLDLREQYVEAAARKDAAADRFAADIRARIATLVAATDVKDYLPGLMLQVGDLDFVDATRANCADVAIPDVRMPLALTSVTSIDSDGANVSALTVASNSWNVYASERNVYLLQTSAGWWFNDLQRQQTAIYKIGVGAGTPVYRALGTVDGWASSSFQLSEHAGFLRVATNRWEQDPATDRWLQDNNLYVLADNGVGSLDTVGSVLGFAPTERIFSARFLGDRGFVVTFRQIDPLFTFDLSNPYAPRLAGQVEIPGVSTYLHPLDDKHLLTIGLDGDENRLNGNFQLQIFDVQNLADPRLVHKLVPTFAANGLAWTAAVFDHLAFNYFPAAGTLTVPVQYYASDLRDHFSGFAAFAVSPATGFAELGRLDHSDLAKATYCSAPEPTLPAICRAGAYLEAANPRRSVSASYAGTTYIYTLSNVGMKVSAAENFATPLAVLPLPLRNDYPWVIAN
jgi:uncharacterized secreted protein with C-terminal beta-propeller domain